MSAHVKFSVDELRSLAYEASETAKYWDRKDLPLNAAIQRDIAEALTDYAQHLKEHEDEQAHRNTIRRADGSEIAGSTQHNPEGSFGCS